MKREGEGKRQRREDSIKTFRRFLSRAFLRRVSVIFLENNPGDIPGCPLGFPADAAALHPRINVTRDNSLLWSTQKDSRNLSFDRSLSLSLCLFSAESDGWSMAFAFSGVSRV